jgi:hypothetical protein
MTIDDTAIDVAIDDIALGHDADGLPKTVPAGKTADPGKTQAAKDAGGKRKAEPRQPTLAELEAARRDRDASARAAVAAQADADASRTRADAEAKARGEAEGALLKTRGQALNEYYSRVSSEFSQITGAISATQALASSAEAALQAAMADEQATPQDRATRVAKAQRELSRAEAELVQLEAGKPAAERAVQEAKWYLQEEDRANTALADARSKAAAAADADADGAGKPAGAKPAGQAKTPEQWIDGIRSTVGAKVADWLSDHKEYVTDPKLNAKVIAFAQHAAVVEEAQLNSDEFIEQLNAKFFPDADEDGDGGGDGHQVEEVREQVPKRQASATPAAPVSRSAGYFSSRNPNAAKIKLSPVLANLAREMGMTPEEYAISARKQILDGKLPKNFLDGDYVPLT